MTGENDTRKKYPIGSAEGRAEADRRIAEANNTGATELDLGGLGLIEIPAGLFALRGSGDVGRPASAAAARRP